MNIVGKTSAKATHIGNQKVEEIVGRMKTQEKIAANFCFNLRIHIEDSPKVFPEE